MNDAAGTPIDAVYGAVTSGFEWMFLELGDITASFDTVRDSIDHPGWVFAILRAMALDAMPS